LDGLELTGGYGVTYSSPRSRTGILSSTITEIGSPLTYSFTWKAPSSGYSLLVKIFLILSGSVPARAEAVERNQQSPSAPYSETYTLTPCVPQRLGFGVPGSSFGLFHVIP
jgi:hypothetical protein